jgi:beta-phosphoglucomutase
LASASKNAFTVIDRLKMREEFDYIADASKIKNSKPAPDVFLDVAKALGCKPIQCIGVEDAKAGIDAIHHAGMFAVGIGDATHLGEAEILFFKTSYMSLEKIYCAYSKWAKDQKETRI